MKDSITKYVNIPINFRIFGILFLIYYTWLIVVYL